MELHLAGTRGFYHCCFLQKGGSTRCSLSNIWFYMIRLLIAWSKTAYQEGRETALCLVSTFWPFRHGWPCSHRLSSQGHRNTQAFPPQQGDRLIVRGCNHVNYLILMIGMMRSGQVNVVSFRAKWSSARNVWSIRNNTRSAASSSSVWCEQRTMGLLHEYVTNNSVKFTLQSRLWAGSLLGSCAQVAEPRKRAANPSVDRNRGKGTTILSPLACSRTHKRARSQAIYNHTFTYAVLCRHENQHLPEITPSHTKTMPLSLKASILISIFDLFNVDYKP